MSKHPYDIQDEKKAIIKSIKKVVQKLHKTPTQKEYKLHREDNDFSIEQILYRYGNWSSAVISAGLEPNPFQQPPRQPEITKEKLTGEFIKVANEVGKIPAMDQFRVKSKYSWTPYKTKWGSWRNAVNYIIKNYSDKFTFSVTSPKNKTEKAERKKLRYKCSLLYEPINEYETIVLFACLADELGFKIKKVNSDFPDAVLENNEKEIYAEFEYLSSNYIQHCHPLDFKGICICWRKDKDIKNIEIISLEEYIRKNC